MSYVSAIREPRNGKNAVVSPFIWLNKGLMGVINCQITANVFFTLWSFPDAAVSILGSSTSFTAPVGATHLVVTLKPLRQGAEASNDVVWGAYLGYPNAGTMQAANSGGSEIVASPASKQTVTVPAQYIVGAAIIWTFDVSSLATGTEFALDVKRHGTDGADTFTGAIGAWAIYMEWT